MHARVLIVEKGFEMSRQERIRQPHPASNAWRNDPSIQEATTEEMQEYLAKERAEFLCEAAENFARSQQNDEIFIGKRVATRGRNVSDYCCQASFNGYECSCS